MGLLKDFRQEVRDMHYHIADEIMGDKAQPFDRHKTQPEPGAVKKLSAAFMSGWYATRNMHRAQMGMSAVNMMEGPGRPPMMHGPNDGCEM